MFRFGAIFCIAVGLTQAVLADVPSDVEPDEPARIEADRFEAPIRLEADGRPIDHGPAWGHTSPWVVDIDGDGVRDLVVGDFSGLFRFYRNEGTDAAPRYTDAGNLQAGGEDAKVPIY